MGQGQRADQRPQRGGLAALRCADDRDVPGGAGQIQLEDAAGLLQRPVHPAEGTRPNSVPAGGATRAAAGPATAGRPAAAARPRGPAPPPRPAGTRRSPAGCGAGPTAASAGRPADRTTGLRGRHGRRAGAQPPNSASIRAAPPTGVNRNTRGCGPPATAAVERPVGDRAGHEGRLEPHQLAGVEPQVAVARGRSAAGTRRRRPARSRDSAAENVLSPIRYDRWVSSPRSRPSSRRCEASSRCTPSERPTRPIVTKTSRNSGLADEQFAELVDDHQQGGQRGQVRPAGRPGPVVVAERGEVAGGRAAAPSAGSAHRTARPSSGRPGPGGRSGW